MLKIITIFPIIVLGAVLNSPLLMADQLTPEVEVTHWWNQPGELDALNEIKSAVESRGAKFVETRVASWDTLRSNILKRISIGYPPAVTQWLSDDYTFSFEQMSAINLLPPKWRKQPIKDVLFEEVYHGLSTKNGLLGLPLGIHTQNAALFNKAIYDELNLPLPTSWSEVLQQAPLIEKAGYVPVALSNETWQLQMILNTILLSEMGEKDYRLFYQKGQSIQNWRASLVGSLDIFLALKKYTDKAARKRSWSDAVTMIGENKAAMHFLGDFAKGELTAQGYKAGEDFLCSLAPGSNGYMVYTIDSFLMFNMDEPYLKKGQSILFDAVLDPEVQARYNSKKGGIPVRHGVEISQLDSCAQETYKRWMNKEKKVISFTGIGNPLRASFLQSILQKAWDNDDITAEQLVDELLTVDQEALQRHE